MDYKYNSESQTVRWSTIVLCASFLLVYVVLYYVKWDVFKWWNEVVENNWWLTVSEITSEIDYSMKNNSWDESKISILNTWTETLPSTISENNNAWNTSIETVCSR